MAGGKGKGKQTRRHKFEKLDLAALDSGPPPSSNVWGSAPPKPGAANPWNVKPTPNTNKDVKVGHNVHSSPMSTGSERFPNWDRHQDVCDGPGTHSKQTKDVSAKPDTLCGQTRQEWEKPGTLFGQKTFAPVHLPYCTIVPEIERWYEGEVYEGEWEAAPFCKIDTDWSKPELKKGLIKRTDDRGTFRVKKFPVQFGAPGAKPKKQDLSYSQVPGGPVTQEPWDYAVLYKIQEDHKPTSTNGINTGETTQSKKNGRRAQKQKNGKKTKGNASKRKRSLGFDDFPDEVLERILRYALQHYEPLPVDLFWQRQPMDEPPPLDYRVMHASKRLYRMGIELYYKLNTFMVDMTSMVYKEDKYKTLGDVPALPLAMFQSKPKNPHKAQWTSVKGLHIARECVRRVILVNKLNNWHTACTFLRGFDLLEEVTFDLRGTGLISDRGWETIEVDDEIRKALVKADIHVPAGMLRVGHTGVKRAAAEMEVQLAPGLLRGAKQYITDDL